MATAKVVSSWSLHRTLGAFVAGDLGPTRRGRALEFAGSMAGRPRDAGGLQLLELPAELRRHGYDAVQLVHFHLPSRDPGYLEELRGELQRQSVRLDTFLLDDGDLTHGTDFDEQAAWMSEWLFDAELLGASRARVIAGRSRPDRETIARSARGMRRIAEEHPGMRILFENWLEMTPDPAAVEALLEQAGDQVGLLVDLANWRGPDVPDRIAAIGGKAETCHAKCDSGGPPEAGDAAERAYLDALTALRAAGFAGTLALVYDGPDPDEWAMLDREYELVREAFDGV